MSRGDVVKKMICKIGKKEDKSDCAKKDCLNCRHWIPGMVWKEDDIEYPIIDGKIKDYNNKKEE
jgi:hypothetical protein